MLSSAGSRFRTLLNRVTSEALRRLQPGDFLLLCFAPPMPPRLKKLCLGVTRLELPFRHGLGFKPARLSGLRPQRLWGAGLQAGIDVARLEIQRLRASGMSSGYPFRPKQVWQLQPTASFGTPSLTPLGPREVVQDLLIELRDGLGDANGNGKARRLRLFTPGLLLHYCKQLQS